ncbi:Asp23/Gls24 family envelope stress response protein [Corynebacterium liangguodongii]|uniref:Uncharacterized protein n=1 Tax=Corynebacterium liangguodongii TaxID=2079535 RepID=A0A2S0WC72_9CORY|nr:Asp23/Gls24 family envelope stress response protein [Corynebacterium liangguodongii]AWB83363.1 hypothetical protein C3E79_01730 [Corynebacterium liangguodongii]PWC00547.1 Asp23/Gls24 family envelope stress response protein [Corynebacterium liangguodongii]
MGAEIGRAEAEAIRAAALSVPGVAGLSGGQFGEVALLLPGAKIPGIRPLTADGRRGVELHVVYATDQGCPIADVATQLREDVAAAADLDFINIIFADATANTTRAL